MSDINAGTFFPRFTDVRDQMNGKKEDIKFWALHALQYLDYTDKVIGES